MNLLFVVPNVSTSGGVEKVVALLTAHLSEAYQHEVTILNCEPFLGRSFYQLHSKVKVQSLNLPAYPLGMAAKIQWYYHLKIAFSSYLNKHQFDIVFAQGGYVATSLSLVKTTAIKVGCEHVSHNAVHFLPRIFNKLLFRKLDAFVVLTDYDQKYYDRFLKKVYVIPNFISALPTETTEQRQPVVVAAGRLEHQKGFDLLIEAFKLVRARHPAWKLEIYGEGTMRTVLQQQISASNLDYIVNLKGQTSHLDVHFRNGAIFVLSSRYEGFPLSLLEAMSQGLGCISFDISGANAVLQNNVNGFLVKQAQVMEMGEAICKLISNDELRQRLGILARKTAQKYEITEVGAQWQCLINQLKRTN